MIITLGWYQSYPKLDITSCCVKVGESVTYSPINTRTVTFLTTGSSVTKSTVDSQTTSIGHQYFIPYKIYGINTDLSFINREPSQ